ncbi:MAG: DUF1801 domain-containing protein [Ideonella sp.]|nr:DUF1801 domain-containing protein [Ideonella sp.]
MSKYPLSPTVIATFNGYPKDIRAKLLRLREMIFEVAAETPGVGALEETLKWGEPAYLTPETRSGSTIRIAWKKSQPEQYSMYFICTTNLVETFRSLFPSDFQFEGNRAINFKAEAEIREDSVRFCIAAALTHRLHSMRGKSRHPHAASEA